MQSFLNDTGFVLKRINFGEADRYLTIYTKNSGKIELIAKGVRRVKSKRASHIELLNHIKFQAVKGPRNIILTEVQLINPYEEAKKNLGEVGSLFLLSEVVEKLCPLHEKNAQVYHLIEHALDNPLELSHEQRMLNFQVNLLIELGFWDRKRQFRDIEDVRQFIEHILERKLKSNLYFGS